LHGTSDTLVPVSQSDTLKSRLDSLGVPCEYYRVPLWPHSMDMAKRVNDFSQKKWRRFLKNTSKNRSIIRFLYCISKFFKWMV
jgi:dipeptidyl aminopeptidase/acylaminoacyl peptidase